MAQGPYCHGNNIKMIKQGYSGSAQDISFFLSGAGDCFPLGYCQGSLRIFLFLPPPKTYYSILSLSPSLFPPHQCSLTTIQIPFVFLAGIISLKIVEINRQRIVLFLQHRSVVYKRMYPSSSGCQAGVKLERDLCFGIAVLRPLKANGISQLWSWGRQVS